MTITEPTVTKLMLARQPFIKKFCTDFHENIINCLVTDIRLETDRQMWAPHKAFILLRREGLIKLPYQPIGLRNRKFSLIHNRSRVMTNCVH